MSSSDMTTGTLTRKIWLLTTCVICSALLCVATAVARPKQKPKPRAKTPAPPTAGLSGSTNVDKPLKVQGQARNLSMMLMLRSREDQIKFIKIRKDFHSEITTTPY